MDLHVAEVNRAEPHAPDGEVVDIALCPLPAALGREQMRLQDDGDLVAGIFDVVGLENPVGTQCRRREAR